MKGAVARIELEVLDANDAFYRAFAARDADAMAALWAEDHPVACVHPGSDVLVGRDAVLASWRAVLVPGGAPDLACSSAQAHVLGDVAFVTCHEVLRQGARLAATNVFARERGAWRLVHHQAAPIAPGPARPKPPAGPAN
jgi:ketosteroid isomerase-like protein